MSPDSFTVVSQESWLKRIGGAFKGILVGLVLFLVSFLVLFWNEGRAVKRHETLEEGAAAVVSVSVDRVDPANAGKLVHAGGMATTEETLSDPAFGVSAVALKLHRTVEMHQWRESEHSETRKKTGGGTETRTTYSYDRVWSEGLIDSGRFQKRAGHENPSSMPHRSTEWVAGEVRIGAFRLPPSLVGKIGSWSNLPVVTPELGPESPRGGAKIHDGGFYIGGDPGSPRIGDLRIRFEAVNPVEVSVVAVQTGGTFEPYRAKAGGTVELLQTGVHSAEAMFERAVRSNTILTWVLRLVGFVVMLLGLNMILRPLSVVADVLPFVGNIVGAGTGLIAFLVAAVLSFGTIALAWLFYRPLLGLALLAVAVALAVAIKMMLGKAKVKVPARSPGPPPPPPPPVPQA